MRKTRLDVKAIGTARSIYEPWEGQFFCELPKSWELWLEKPLMRLRRWDKRRVYWIYLRKEEDNG